MGGSIYRGEDFRSSFSRSASHLRDAVAGKGRTRDGHHDTVGAHHFADDFSLQSCHAGEPADCGRITNGWAFAAPFGGRERHKRAKSAPTRYWDRRKVIGEMCKLLKKNGGGDRTRTCISFRTAVFKTAALPLCDPSVDKQYSLAKTYVEILEGGRRMRPGNCARKTVLR